MEDGLGHNIYILQSMMEPDYICIYLPCLLLSEYNFLGKSSVQFISNMSYRGVHVLYPIYNYKSSTDFEARYTSKFYDE